jgi:predicted enzyme related to lactoylglutathione lyase
VQDPTNLNNRPRWVDLATSDQKSAQEFYSALFGWRMDVSDDPQYGGYAMGMLGDRSTAGIGGTQDEAQPNAWSLYIGTDDIDALSAKIAEEGGTVVAPPFEVGDQGRMAVFQDPSGAFISAWQGVGAADFIANVPNAFGWAELWARGVDGAIPFYEKVFGWTTRTSDMAPGQPPYNEFQLDGESVLGALEMDPMVPEQVPSYWQVYFAVEDVDASFGKATELGAKTMVPPQDFPGGRFAILSDPQGAAFAILKTHPRD